METGPLLYGSGCPATKMDTYVPLCFSPIFSNRESLKENPRGESYFNSHYSNMEVATLVPLALENEHKKSDLTSSQEEPSHEPSRVNSPTHRIGKLKTSGVVNFKQRMVPEGQVHKLVTNQPGISGLAGVQRQIHFFRCSIKSVTYFLADLFETGLEYRTLNFYRSIISAFHENGNSVPTGRHSLVFFLMKGIGYSLPLTTWYNFIWDIEQVLNYISSLPPNSKLSLKLLSLKLAMLLVLVATNRGSEIKNLDTNFLVKSKNKAVFSLKGFTKTSNPGKQPPDVIFYSFTGNEDLCPVKTLEFYLKVSESWRRKGDRSQLFLSFVKPYK